jgi:hypothetical protein
MTFLLKLCIVLIFLSPLYVIPWQNEDKESYEQLFQNLYESGIGIDKSEQEKYLRIVTKKDVNLKKLRKIRYCDEILFKDIERLRKIPKEHGLTHILGVSTFTIGLFTSIVGIIIFQDCGGVIGGVLSGLIGGGLIAGEKIGKYFYYANGEFDKLIKKRKELLDAVRYEDIHEIPSKSFSSLITSQGKSVGSELSIDKFDREKYRDLIKQKNVDYKKLKQIQNCKKILYEDIRYLEERRATLSNLLYHSVVMVGCGLFCASIAFPDPNVDGSIKPLLGLGGIIIGVQQMYRMYYDLLEGGRLKKKIKGKYDRMLEKRKAVLEQMMKKEVSISK